MNIATAPEELASRQVTRWLVVASPTSFKMCVPLRTAPGLTSMTRMPASCSLTRQTSVAVVGHHHRAFLHMKNDIERAHASEMPPDMQSAQHTLSCSGCAPVRRRRQQRSCRSQWGQTGRGTVGGACGHRCPHCCRHYRLTTRWSRHRCCRHRRSHVCDTRRTIQMWRPAITD